MLLSVYDIFNYDIDACAFNTQTIVDKPLLLIEFPLFSISEMHIHKHANSNASGNVL